jgi:diguanylate cyclase (GGDEF)-like protein
MSAGAYGPMASSGSSMPGARGQERLRGPGPGGRNGPGHHGLAHARQRLEQANRQNETLLNSAADGIYGLDLEGRITFANPAAVALTGYTVEETLGRQQHELVHHTRADGTAYPLEDRQGHQAGDRVLPEVAETLVRESRTSDAFYRYGGEEPLVLLAEQTLAGALIVCEGMRSAVQGLGLAHADIEAGVLTISIGAAACSQGAQTDPADAITRADRALYAAKAQGRNRVVAGR